jgi:hypothetical protein
MIIGDFTHRPSLELNAEGPFCHPEAALEAQNRGNCVKTDVLGLRYWGHSAESPKALDTQSFCAVSAAEILSQPSRHSNALLTIKEFLDAILIRANAVLQGNAIQYEASGVPVLC